MEVKEYAIKKAREAKQGARSLAKASTEKKNKAILAMASLLTERAGLLISENAKDVAAAQAKGLPPALIDRLTLKEKTISDMAAGLVEIVGLTDPVGEVLHMWTRPNGMTVGKMRVPIGVVCMIYESRPNVTADAAALCLKAGNAVVLRGGSEALHSNKAIAALLKEALVSLDLDERAVTFIDNPDRAAVMELLKLEGLIDLVIPRGGEGLIRTVTENSRIPVLKHYKGVCHVYVDDECNRGMAQDICFNAKVQRPGTCNAMETMLVARLLAPSFLPSMLERFTDAGVVIKGCAETLALFPGAQVAQEKDYDEEYLGLTVNVKVVKDWQEAVDHINKHGSAHTDAIVTDRYDRAMAFLREVDSSAVMVNASTRLNDGGQFGMGAEIGISTDKIHARGPMGIEELTCTKFIVLGSGQLRQ